jgi:hypothetical protein
VNGRVTIVSLVVAAYFVAFGALHYGFYTRGLLSDTPVYERYGDRVVDHGDVPYRDFSVEYPPAALPVFVLPAAVSGSSNSYRAAFEVLMLVCGAVAAAVVGFLTTPARALLAALAPLALGPVVLSRFDLWPAMLSVLALAALVGGRRRAAGATLGVAVAAKLYPAVLLPLVVVYAWRRDGRRAALEVAAWTIGAAAAVFLPFAVLAPHGLWSSLTGQASRPLQIESLGASLLLAAHQAWGLVIEQVNSHGSDNLAGSLPDALAVAHGILAPLVLLAIWTAFARGEATRERLLRYAAAAVCAFIAFNKVFSPQFLIWLIPLVPLVRRWSAQALFVAALVLTQLWFPSRYLDLAWGFDARVSWLLLARDLVVLALLAALLVRRQAIVLPIVVCALAAVGAAAAGVSSPKALSHSRVLDETGVASTCAARKKTPDVGSATVRYAVTGYENTRDGAACVTVTVRSSNGQPLFSAAYRDGFYPTDPGRNYLGDAGACTNVAQHPASVITYAFRVPAHGRYAVEVEHCTSNDAPPAYSIQVTSSAAATSSSERSLRSSTRFRAPSTSE